MVQEEGQDERSSRDGGKQPGGGLDAGGFVAGNAKRGASADGGDAGKSSGGYFCGERGGYSSGGGGRAGSAPAWPAEIPRREAARRDGRASRAGCSARPHRRNDDDARNHAGAENVPRDLPDWGHRRDFREPPGCAGADCVAGAQERQCRAAQGRARGGADERRAVRRAPGSGFRRISRSCCIPARTSPRC